MTGNIRCRARPRMMGRGAEGGCGTEEKPCPAHRPTSTNIPAPASSREKIEQVRFGVDVYTQALKALSERSPFDSNEVLATTVRTLPSGLASVLSKHADGRTKLKRPHSDTKTSGKGSTEKSKGANVWFELEDYFRELTFQDIEMLCRMSSSFAYPSTSDARLNIPVVGTAQRNSKTSKDIENGHGGNVQVPEAKTEKTVCDGDSVSDSGVLESQEGSGEIEQGKVDSGSRGSFAQSCSSVEWVLGSRNRVLLTTTRPTKKRKFVGENAGLERLIVAQPCEGSSSLCHVCSMGDVADQLNQLVVCKSCNVVVHQKCYGVQGEVDESWLCAWCKHIVNVKAGRVSVCDRPCVLCPKAGGAVKRFKRLGGGSGESLEFAHLFCSQWMPEVYIDDTRLMEPLLSVGGGKDVQGKLLCSLCKVRGGSCVRCSNGSCRASFHPICAREARNKLEIWGKFGCDDIELRGFCAKHSRSAAVKHEQNHNVGGDLLATSYQPGLLSVNKIKKLKIGCKNGDKVILHIGAADTNLSNLGKCESEKIGPKDVCTSSKPGLGDEKELGNVETIERNMSENVKISHHLDLSLILKKLIDRRKVSLQQIASDIGISADSLASKIDDNHLDSELYSKILVWFKDHAYVDSFERDLATKVKSLILSKDELKSIDNAVAVQDLDISDIVPVKSVPPRRRTVGNIGISKEDECMPRWNDKLMGNGVSKGEGTGQEHNDGHEKPNNSSVLNSTDKIIVEGYEGQVDEPSPTSESFQLKTNLCDVERNRSDEGTDSGKSSLVDMDVDVPSFSSVDTCSHYDGDKHGSESFVHPYIQMKLEEVQNWLSQTMSSNYDGCFEQKVSSSEQPPNSCIGRKAKSHLVSLAGDKRNYGVDLYDLDNSKEMGILDLCPENEVEGQIIFYQRRLLDNAVSQKHCTDQLAHKIVRNLPQQMDVVRKQRWDDVLVNQYIYELKEARKQGRKEKRYKEAQAVLAAATAAAAASSRASSFRKDAVDESVQELKLGSSRVRGGQFLPVIPRAKETYSSLSLPKVTSDRYSDFSVLTSGSPKGHQRSCDICGRTDSLLNTILVCSSCKITVHLNCYRSARESTGPWYCELCEESSISEISSTAAVNYSDKPRAVDCGLCGLSHGAFRKSSNGEWIHAFCAEWVFDSTFTRGQVCQVEGMETVLKGKDICCVCESPYGVCIKCNYGNCQATFHPSCARSAGYYLYARNVGGGRIQHKAYCSKHCLEQRSKIETQKHATEDLKIAKQHRVKLEKLRLLCERIVKREKLKRELLICSHDIIAYKRDSLAASIPVAHPYLLQEVSSESATTSLKGHSDGPRSCSEALKNSDDVTVESALSAKKCIRLALTVENDQKTDNSSTSQYLPTPKLTDRVSFGGKQIPIRATMVCRNFSQRGEKKLKSKKNVETFKKELLMTSDQALKKNKRLPKGYVYVPMDCLSHGEKVARDSVERKE